MRQARDRSETENKARFEEIFEGLKDELQRRDAETAEKDFEDQTLGDFAALREIINELDRTKSVLAALVGLRYPGSLYEQLEPKLRFENTIYAVTNLVQALSLLRPVVLSLDDIQWLDSDSLQLLQYLTRNVADFRVAIICTSRYRDDGSRPVLTVDEHIPQLTLDLSEMSGAQVRSITEQTLEQPVSDELVAYLKQKTNGNPFFTEQLCLTLHEQNILTESKDGLTLSGTDAVSVPDSIRAVLIARLDRLSREVKEVVTAGAVVGREFEVQVLSAMLKRDVSTAIETGEQEQVWRPLAEWRYIFRHVLLRDAAYQMQLRSQLQELHKLAAESMETLYADRLSEFYNDLAFHFERAQNNKKAIHYLHKAADQAREQYQNQQAIELYQLLLNKVGGQPKYSQKQFQIYDSLCQVYGIIGESEQAKQTAEQALIIGRQLNSNQHIGKALISLRKLSQDQGRYDESLSHAREALHHYQEADNRQGIIDALAGIGLIYDLKGKYKEAMETYQNALDLPDANQDLLQIAKIKGNMAIVLRMQNQLKGSLSLHQEKIRIVESLNDIFEIGKTYGSMGNVHCNDREFDKALHCYEKSLQISREIGYRKGAFIALGNIGTINLKQSHFQEAFELFIEVLTICREIGNPPGQAIALRNTI